MEIIAIIMTVALVAVVIIFSVALIGKTRRNADNRIEAVKDEYKEQVRDLNRRLEEQTVILKNQSTLEFRAIADEILREREKTMSIENNRQINETINPLRENLKQFNRVVTDFYLRDAESRQSLKTQIEHLILSNKEIGDEARRLSTALTSNNSQAGRWGETVLKSVLSSAGLLEGVNFVIQPATWHGHRITGEDSDQRPDVIVMLPEDHNIVIDSKASIKDYLDYCNAGNAEDARSALKRHADSIRKNIDILARKNYHRNIPGAMEHTLMFIPNDAAYVAAVTFDTGLCAYAASRNVAIVSSTHLMSVIQMAGQLWRVERQNRNAEEIARLGGLVFDKMSRFLEDFKTIDAAIKNVADTYDRCTDHIEHPSVGIRARALRLKELGVKATRKLPNA